MTLRNQRCSRWWTTLLLLGVGVFLRAATADAASIRLAWDPSPTPGVVGYRVYVGIQTGVYTQVFDVGNVTSFEYEAVEVRRYYFAVASYIAGPVVGPLLEEVSSYPSSLTSSPPADPGGDPIDVLSPAAHTAHDAADSRGRVVCWDTSTKECSTAFIIGRVSGRVSSLAPTPDARLFFIEDGRGVRVISGNAQLPEPALTVDVASLRLTQVVIDPNFLKTRFVYVSETETLFDGRRQLHISRYRELEHQLGERAVVVSGLPLQADGDAVFTLDSNGYLYVAAPSTREPFSRGQDAYGGFLLRFNVDGTVPRENRAGSPIFAKGYAWPTALVWHAADQRLWLAGVDREWPHSVAILPLRSADPGEWPRVPQGWRDGTEHHGNGSNWTAALALGRHTAQSDVDLFLLSSAGTLQRTRIRQDGLIERPPATMRLAIDEELLAVATGLRQDIYIAARLGRPSALEPFAILRVRPLD